jgi:opacity protein-like surface antigen
LPGSVGSGSEWAFGYQGTAGIAFNVDEKHAITIGYRYQAAEDVTITGRNVEYASHNISIGVVFD